MHKRESTKTWLQYSFARGAMIAKSSLSIALRQDAQKRLNTRRHRDKTLAVCWVLKIWCTECRVERLGHNRFEKGLITMCWVTSSGRAFHNEDGTKQWHHWIGRHGICFSFLFQVANKRQSNRIVVGEASAAVHEARPIHSMFSPQLFHLRHIYKLVSSPILTPDFSCLAISIFSVKIRSLILPCVSFFFSYNPIFLA